MDPRVKYGNDLAYPGDPTLCADTVDRANTPDSFTATFSTNAQVGVE
jgi:hypothetical protein